MTIKTNKQKSIKRIKAMHKYIKKSLKRVQPETKKMWLWIPNDLLKKLDTKSILR